MPTDKGQKTKKVAGSKKAKSIRDYRTSKGGQFRAKVPPPVDADTVVADPALAAKRLFAEENRAVVKALRDGTSLDRFRPEEQKPNPYLPFPTSFYETVEGRAVLGAAKLANERLDGFLAAGEQAAQSAVARAERMVASAQSEKNVAGANYLASYGTSSEQQQREVSARYVAATNALELAELQLAQAKKAASVWPKIRVVALETFSTVATPVLTKTLSRFARWAEVGKEFRYQVGLLPADPAVERDILDLREQLVLLVDGLEIKPSEGRTLITQLDAKLSAFKAPLPDDLTDEALLIDAEAMDLEDLREAIEQAKAGNALLAARLEAIYNRRKSAGGDNPGKTGSDDGKLFGLPTPVVVGGGILAAILILRKRG